MIVCCGRRLRALASLTSVILFKFLLLQNLALADPPNASENASAEGQSPPKLFEAAPGAPAGVQYSFPVETIEGGKRVVRLKEVTIIVTEGSQQLEEVAVWAREQFEKERELALKEGRKIRYEGLAVTGGAGRSSEKFYGNEAAFVVGEKGGYDSVIAMKRMGELTPSDGDKELEEVARRVKSIVGNENVPLYAARVAVPRSSHRTFVIIRGFGISGLSQVSFMIGALNPLLTAAAAAWGGMMSAFLMHHNDPLNTWFSNKGFVPVSEESRIGRFFNRYRPKFDRLNQTRPLKFLRKYHMNPVEIFENLFRPVSTRQEAQFFEAIAKDFVLSVPYYGSVKALLGAFGALNNVFSGFWPDVLAVAAKGAISEGFGYAAIASVSNLYMKERPENLGTYRYRRKIINLNYSLFVTTAIIGAMINVPIVTPAAILSLKFVTFGAGALFLASKFNFSKGYVIKVMDKVWDASAAIGRLAKIPGRLIFGAVSETMAANEELSLETREELRRLGSPQTEKDERRMRVTQMRRKIRQIRSYGVPRCRAGFAAVASSGL